MVYFILPLTIFLLFAKTTSRNIQLFVQETPFASRCGDIELLVAPSSISRVVVTPAIPRLRRYRTYSCTLEHFPRLRSKRYQMPELRIPLECLGVKPPPKKSAHRLGVLIFLERKSYIDRISANGCKLMVVGAIQG